MPGNASPASSAIQTRASTRRTPSTNSTAAGPGAVGSGVIASQRSAGSSTSTLTVSSVGTSSSSTDAPYSTLHGSTLNLTISGRSGLRLRSPVHPFDGRRLGALGHPVLDRHAVGQLAHMGDDTHHAVAGPE